MPPNFSWKMAGPTTCGFHVPEQLMVSLWASVYLSKGGGMVSTLLHEICEHHPSFLDLWAQPLAPPWPPILHLPLRLLCPLGPPP